MVWCHLVTSHDLNQTWPDTLQLAHYGRVLVPDSKVHGVNMGPIWVLSAPDGPHVGPMNLAIRGAFSEFYIELVLSLLCCGQYCIMLDHSLSLVMLKSKYSSSTRSMLWLLMPWLLAYPGHQQPWYWLHRVNRLLSSTKRYFNYLQHLSVENCRKCRYVFFFFKQIEDEANVKLFPVLFVDTVTT